MIYLHEYLVQPLVRLVTRKGLREPVFLDPPPDVMNQVLVPVLNPAVTQATIKQTICKRGWDSSVRPPLAWTSPIKRAMVKALPPNVSHRLSDYELDHFWPICVGGQPKPTSAEQPMQFVLMNWPRAKRKDVIELNTSIAICSGKLTLAQGQDVFTKMVSEHYNG